MLPVLDITSLIPQKFPFVMIDTLLASDDTSTRSGFTVRKENIFVEDGVFTEPGLLENIAQTAAARVGFIAARENKPVPLGFIGAVKNFEVHALPHTGDELVTEITIANQVFDFTIIAGKVMCNDLVLATCEMKIMISPGAAPVQ